MLDKLWTSSNGNGNPKSDIVTVPSTSQITKKLTKPRVWKNITLVFDKIVLSTKKILSGSDVRNLREAWLFLPFSSFAFAGQRNISKTSEYEYNYERDCIK